MPQNEAYTRRRWRRWILAIRRRTQDLVIDDSYFRLAMDAAQRAKIPAENQAYQWIMRQYGQISLLGIRRLIDKDLRTYSLHVLLHEIEMSPHILSRRSFVSLYRDVPDLRNAAHRHFDDLAGSQAAHIPASHASDDLAKIDSVRKRFVVIQNQFVTHNQRKPKYRPRHKWQEIHDAIGELEQIADRWEQILTASTAGPLGDEVAQFNAVDFRRMWTSEA